MSTHHSTGPLRRRWSASAITAAVALLTGCGELPFLTLDVEVRVEDTRGQPIAGAIVTGGIDWDQYTRTTNRSGETTIPREQRGRPAEILALNHFPRTARIESKTYRLVPTAGRIRQIGTLRGTVLRMTDTDVLALDPYRTLHHYAVGTGTVVKQSSVELALGGAQSGVAELFGDELWIVRGDGTVQVWSVAVPAMPAKVREYPRLGLLLARQDSLVAIWNNHVTEIWAVRPDGSAEKLSAVPLRGRTAKFEGTTLYLRHLTNSEREVHLAAVDLRVPRAPVIKQQVTYSGYGAITFFGDRVILTPAVISAQLPVRHAVLDLSGGSAREDGFLTGNAYITQLVDDSTALGFTADTPVGAVVALDWPQRTVRIIATTASRVAEVWPYPQNIPVGAASGSVIHMLDTVWQIEAR